jgi:hypothetical protein
MRTTSALLAITGSLLAATASAQVPQCTVPNTLVNGQVADATDVMENFNAVAACVDSARGDAVTRQGTPTTGAVAVFASPTSITNGNLTGDVTTTGTTATQLAPSGVAPGTYTNATVTVDAKGRVTSAQSGTGATPGSILAYATLFNQPTYTLPAGTSTIVNVSGVNEVMIIAYNITKGAAGSLNVQFSIDGGVTYVTSASYHLDVSTAGVIGSNATAIIGTAAIAAARSFHLQIPNLRSSTPKLFLGSRAGIFSNANPITHIRIYSTLGDITGGSLTVLGR